MSGRTIGRWVVRVVGVVLVVVLAALLVLRIYGGRRLAAAERAFAAAVGPMKGDPYVSASVGDEENAAIYLRAGSDAVILPKVDKARAGDLTTKPPAAWNDDDRAFVRRLLERNAPPLELLHRAPAFPKSSFGLRHPNSDRYGLLELIRAQRLLYLESGLALKERDTQRFVTAARSMSTMAGAVEKESPPIWLLIGVAAEKIFLSAVKEAVADPSTDREVLTRLQAMLVDTDLEAAWRRSNAAEQFRINRAVADAPRSERGGDGVRERVLEFAVGKILGAQQLELRAEMARAVSQPLGLNPRWAGLGKRRPSGLLAMFRVFESVMFGPTLQSSIGRLQSTLSLRNLARTALALRLQGIETGSYPETLSAFADATRPDPFAGKPLAYERRPDGSALVAVPGFAFLWREVSDASASVQPYAWELPPPRGR